MLRAIGAILFAGLVAAAQTPEFEVASIKPSPPPSGRIPIIRFDGGPGTKDPTRISWRNIPMSLLLTTAYDVNGADIVGPAWVTTFDFMSEKDKFDIDARTPPNTSKEQFHLMLRKLLDDRFAVKLHREKKEVPAYGLALAKEGAKIKAAPPVPDDPYAQSVDVTVRGEDGFPVTPPGYSGLFVGVKSGHTRVKFLRYSMDQFAKWTRTQSKRPGVDRTGMAGVYSFYLEFDNEIGGPDAADQGPAFAVALEKQLGLKLVSDKAEIELLVIDHIDRTPAGN